MDSICQKIAAWIPKRLVYFCTIRLFAYASCGKYGNTDATKLDIITALKRWETKNESYMSEM